MRKAARDGSVKGLGAPGARRQSARPRAFCRLLACHARLDFLLDSQTFWGNLLLRGGDFISADGDFISSIRRRLDSDSQSESQIGCMRANGDIPAAAAGCWPGGARWPAVRLLS